MDTEKKIVWEDPILVDLNNASQAELEEGYGAYICITRYFHCQIIGIGHSPCNTFSTCPSDVIAIRG